MVLYIVYVHILMVMYGELCTLSSMLYSSDVAIINVIYVRMQIHNECYARTVGMSV